MKKRVVVATLLFVAWSAFAVNPLNAAPFTDLIVFGDSLTDTGNDFDLSGGSFPTPPNYEGRFSNGPVWVEYLASALGLPAPAASRLGGKNFAYGGAQTGSGTSTIADGVPNVGPQIDEFLATGRVLTGEDLVVLWAGHNDLAGGIAPSVAVANLSSHITTLHANGGGNFLVGNISGSDQLNTMLADELQRLTANLSISIATLDFAGLIDEIVANPGAFGFTNISSPAWNERTGEVVANPEEYVRWDSVPHPTTACHRIIGQRAAKAVATIPEPSTWALAVIALLALLARCGLRCRLSNRPMLLAPSPGGLAEGDGQQ